MSFDQYMNQSWQDHARQPQKVMQDFELGLVQVENSEHLIAMARLMTHVMGEHLGLWSQAIEVLQDLKKHSQISPEVERSIEINIEALKLSSGVLPSGALENASERVQAKAIAASALVDRDTERSLALFQSAVDLAQSLPEGQDPAYRALAVAGNNLASALEQKPNRTFLETGLMVLAAQAGRKFWEKAGTWLQVERAEYRLSITCLKANLLPLSLRHAQNCIEICQKNQANPLELFFGYEALAQVEKARENESGFDFAREKVRNYFDQLSETDKSWCKKNLIALDL